MQRVAATNVYFLQGMASRKTIWAQWQAVSIRLAFWNSAGGGSSVRSVFRSKALVGTILFDFDVMSGCVLVESLGFRVENVVDADEFLGENGDAFDLLVQGMAELGAGVPQTGRGVLLIAGAFQFLWPMSHFEEER